MSVIPTVTRRVASSIRGSSSEIGASSAATCGSDSGGAGRSRGGLGYTRRYEILKDGAGLAIYADRFRLAPQGLFGGFEGTCARLTVERDGTVIDVPSKGALALKKGDIVVIATGGGAGYGDPAERDPALIAADVAEGWITPEAARRDYGWGEAAE